MKVGRFSKGISGFTVYALLAVSPLTAAFSVKRKIELGFHFSSWSLNFAKGFLDTAMGDALKSRMLNLAREAHPGLVENSSSTSVDIDSSGGNFGFDIRWNPAGEKGSFSLGLSIEKTSMKVMVKEARATASLDIPDGEASKSADFNGQGSGTFQLAPWSIHVNFRWEIKPAWRIHPYMAMGFGCGSGRYLDQGTLQYDVQGDLLWLAGGAEHYQESGTKTLAAVKNKMGQDAESEGKVLSIPFWFVPFFQLSLGVKGKIADDIYLVGEAAFWDGFILRAGIAYRF